MFEDFILTETFSGEKLVQTPADVPVVCQSHTSSNSVFSIRLQRGFPECHVIRVPEPGQNASRHCSPLLGKRHPLSSLPSNWAAARRLYLLGGFPLRLNPARVVSGVKAGEHGVSAGSNMRSLTGLAAIVGTASVYLYLLSTHLPPGPKALQPGTEEEEHGEHR